MKICLTDRGQLLAQLELDSLSDLGLKGLEFYLPSNIALSKQNQERIERYRGLDYQLIAHLGERPDFSLWPALLTELDQLGVSGFIVHPWGPTYSRPHSQLQTRNLYRLTPKNFRGQLYLENLPHSSDEPTRFGSRLAEVADFALPQGWPLCLDTGHYLAGVVAGICPAELKAEWLTSVGHVHLHAFISGRNHQPSYLDDGRLAELIKQFRLFRPDYSGLWSIEIMAGNDVRTTVQRSLDWLKDQLAT